MGGGTRRFKRGNRHMANKRREKKNIADGEDPRGPRKHYEDIIRNNPNFETYYIKQQIVPEIEFSEFLAALRRDLPTAFRISTCSVSEAQALLKIVEGDLFKGLLEEALTGQEGEVGAKPFCLPWYPSRLGWQLQITRKDIRRSENYFRLHNFLISETASGNISRQETVSMIPPLLLDVQPEHKVLDMCAAPGSKTAQLIESMYTKDNSVPSGLVIGNDIDNSRCYMLVHQAKRLNSPCVIVTNHDSTNMPNFHLSDKDGNKTVMKFDRILCDVPCTGDGTLRKNADIWTKWNTANGNNLHGVQFRVVKRALEMLSIGGRVVYSTCSLNPIENEAVMHRMIVESEGAVQLVDERSRLTGLVSRPGISKWFPASRDMVMYDSYDTVPEKFDTQVRPQMFPPKQGEEDQFHLDRCIRILPHDQDTGGFFVAVLEKTRRLPWEAEASSSEDAGGKNDSEEVAESAENGKRSSRNGPDKKKRRIQGYKEDPFVFFDESEPVWPSLREFFDLDAEILNGLLTRCAVGKKKNIYFTSPAVKQILLNNQERVKIINSGVKCFVRCDNKKEEGTCNFRLAQEGLASITRFVGGKRRIKVSRSDMATLLANSDPKAPTQISVLEPATQEAVAKLEHGSCILDYEGDDGLTISLVGWRGVHSMRAYIAISDSVHYLRLLGEDVSKFEVNKFKKESAIENIAELDVLKEDSVLDSSIKEDVDEKTEKEEEKRL
ncbi:tRNA (cytosine(34)-C(5))-methyltransferase [Nilaparvata lugens]|uniref:tRNA (cytosine(34)-C(5))-methyltransferase n=1 Tax=Nilaparvata lugens TaxID=108931 RepID=UPI00193CF373|nr:tRNA (cytosine(34)-C(5))-methyltransferase [Nilaparvata lugens]